MNLRLRAFNFINNGSKNIRLKSSYLLRVMKRLDEFNEEVNGRLESEEYMQIVRKPFRSWDKSDTQEKKELISKIPLLLSAEC